MVDNVNQKLVRGPILANKIGLARPLLTVKVVQRTRYSAIIGPGWPILRGTDFGVADLTYVAAITKDLEVVVLDNSTLI